MKRWAWPECSPSFSKIACILASFSFVISLCVFASMNEMQVQNLMNLGRSAFPNFHYEASSNTSSDTSLAKETSSTYDFRLFIGIFALPDLYRRRNMLRLIYGLQHPSNVQVDFKFIFCNLNKEDQTILVALEIMKYNDIIILNCTENMNDGKTYTYFSSLPNLLSPYDYVMKADDDTFIRLDRLVESLKPLPREDMYYGFVIPCESVDPVGRYMSGMGYIISWDLVEWIATSDAPRNQTIGPEDLLVGQWLNDANLAKNRYDTKPAMYNYPVPDPGDVCSHPFVPDTIAVHHLKDQNQWIRTLQYFNFTNQLEPSKLYHIPHIA